MRMPKRGEKGFTLIELLIVVAILGVLAAVIIPNVTRFFGAGKTEARRTERATVQLAVEAMMLSNSLSSIPNPIDNVTGTPTQDMGAYPDTTSLAGGDDKLVDKDGNNYEAGLDDDGYLLYGNDEFGNGAAPDAANPAVDHMRRQTSTYFYTCDSDGTVHQYLSNTLANEQF